jgi:hypothetical protein
VAVTKRDFQPQMDTDMNMIEQEETEITEAWE